MLLHFLTKYTRSGQVLPLLLCNIALLYMLACTYKYRHTCRHVKYAHMFLGTCIHAISFERNVYARLCIPCAEGVAGSLCPESARSYAAPVSDSKCVCVRERARAREGEAYQRGISGSVQGRGKAARSFIIQRRNERGRHRQVLFVYEYVNPCVRILTY